MSVNAGGGLAGQKLSFAFHDDQTNPQVDVQLVGELLASNPAIILGPASTGGCRAAAPLVKQGPLLDKIFGISGRPLRHRCVGCVTQDLQIGAKDRSKLCRSGRYKFNAEQVGTFAGNVLHFNIAESPI